MPIYLGHNWFPQPSDIQPNPESPFPNTPSEALTIPLTPLEIKYQEICTMLKYTERAKKKTANDKKKHISELQAAVVRLNMEGDEGKDGRERAKKVIVLEKSIRVHGDYEKNLEDCEGKLRENENELKRILKGRAAEMGDAEYYEGRDFWYEKADTVERVETE